MNILTGRDYGDEVFYRFDDDGPGPWICALSLQDSRKCSDIGAMPNRDDDIPIIEGERCDEERQYNRWGREERGRSRNRSSRSIMALESTAASSGTQQVPRQRHNSRDLQRRVSGPEVVGGARHREQTVAYSPGGRALTPPTTEAAEE